MTTARELIEQVINEGPEQDVVKLIKKHFGSMVKKVDMQGGEGSGGEVILNTTIEKFQKKSASFSPPQEGGWSWGEEGDFSDDWDLSGEDIPSDTKYLAFGAWSRR